jgi:hypothetical protein
MHSITFAAVAALKIHPLNKALPAWADDDPRFVELCASIQEFGIQVPLILDAQHQIVDGAHRYRAAKRVGLVDVPVIVKPDAEIASVIVSTLVDRKHYTKGQMAYICAPLFDRLFSEAKARRAASAAPLPLPKTAEALADRLGVSARLVEYARHLHKLFAEEPEFKEFMEPRILAPDDPIGLGAAIAGHAGWKSTKGKARPDKRDAEQLWFKAFNGLCFQTGRLGDVKHLGARLATELETVDDVKELVRLKAVGQSISAAAAARLKKLDKGQ